MAKGVLDIVLGVGRALRAASVAPSLLGQRRRALNIFAEGLRAKGLDPEDVQQLTAAYKELGSFGAWLSNSRE